MWSRANSSGRGQTKLAPCSLGTTWPQQHQSGAGTQHLPCLCPQLPHRRNRVTIPAMPSICVSGPRAASGRDHRMSYNTMSTRLRPGMPSLQGEKVSRESNSLYLWITTAAFNSLE